MNDHYLELGGSGPALQLAPANGFPPEAYRPLAAALGARHRVLGYRPRPLWDGSRPSIKSWHELADDMLAAMEEELAEPVIGAGHSLGGILTLYSAVRHPERFRGVALIDPVIMPRHLLPLLWAGRRVGLHRRHPLARGAARRRASFASAEEARARYQGRGLFAGFAPEALEGYLEGGLRPHADGGVTLAWPREWEAHIFSLAPVDTWGAVRRLQVPLLIVRGASSDMLIDSSWARLRRVLPRASLVELPGGHMVPMEQPAAVAAAILAWAARLGQEQ
jgi:pimeloyl-ACP methyl ester carboxylesterase